VESVEEAQVELESIPEPTSSLKIPMVHELVCELHNPPDDYDDDAALCGASLDS